MIDTQLASFLQEGLGIYLGTRDDALRPEGARALAAAIDADGAHVTVYAAEIAAERLRANLESNGQIAVSFARPIDDRACQVKGVCVGIRPASGEERPLIDGQWAAFMRSLDAIGIPSSLAGAWVTWPALAIRLRVTAVFDQTPGPHAGAALE
ncbi:MAG TPA: hypothetical protein VF198_07345 [Vicinamibacterales bacterium]